MNIATPSPKQLIKDTTSHQQWSNMPFWYLIDIQETQLHAKRIVGSLGEQSLKKILIKMNSVQNINFIPIFHHNSGQQKEDVFFSDNWYDVLKNITFR